MYSSKTVKILTLNDGNKMPALGLGTALTNADVLNDLISNAIDIGYRYIDTAQLYENHVDTGKAIANALASGKVKREDLFITSKLAVYNSRPGDVTSSLIEWLEEMNLDYVDLFLIHHPAALKSEAKGQPIDLKDFDKYHEIMDHAKVWNEMESLVSRGLTKSIGVSNFTQEQLSTVLQYCTIKPAIIQNECNVYLQENKLVQFCKDNDITFFAYAPHASSGTKHGKRVGVDIFTEKVLCDMASRYNKSPAQIALRFLVQRGLGVASGCTNINQLKENIKIFDFELSANDMDELRKLDCGKRTFTYPFMKNHPQDPYPNK